MTKSSVVEILGYVAASLTTGSFIPGVINVWKMKPRPATSISLAMYIVISLGVAGWFIYGVLVWKYPIMVANFITFWLTVSILYYKKVYG